MVTPVRISPEFASGDIGVEVATGCPVSQDNYWILITQSGGWFRLHDGGGKYVRTLPSHINTSSRPRWSRTDPDVLTYIKGNTLVPFNVAEGLSLAPLHIFREYIRINTEGQNGIDDRGEADLSIDGAHRVFAGKRPDGTEEVFVYDLTTGIKGPPVPLPADTDGLKLSPDNRIIISRPSGIFVDGRQITPFNSHACPCVYKGRPHLAWFNGDKNLVLVDLDTAAQTVVPFIVDSNIYVAHVSACDRPLLVVSTSAPENNAPSQIVRISLEDLSAEVLCNTGTVYRDYNSQPKAAVSRDGSRVVFSVDDGKQIGAWMMKLETIEKPVPALSAQVLTFDLAKYDVSISKGTMTVKAA